MTRHGQQQLDPFVDAPWSPDADVVCVVSWFGRPQRRSTGQTVVEGEDQESGIGFRQDHGWKDSTVSTGEMIVEGEDQESGKRDHGWLDSMLGTGDTVVEREDQKSGRGIMAGWTDQLTSKNCQYDSI
jgi:hypothetical protein